MKNNKGFIAISLIYSFFLVFLVTLLTILNSYTHNRVLLNNVKKYTQEYLEEKTEFTDETSLYSTYSVRDSVTIFGEDWQVIEDEGDALILILDRNFDRDDIENSIDNLSDTYKNAILNELEDDGKVSMCTSYTIDSLLCSSSSNYQWDRSIVKRIVEGWISQDGSKYDNMRNGIIGSISIPDDSMYDNISSSYQDEIWYKSGSSAEKRWVRPIIKVPKSS